MKVELAEQIPETSGLSEFGSLTPDTHTAPVKVELAEHIPETSGLSEYRSLSRVLTLPK